MKNRNIEIEVKKERYKIENKVKQIKKKVRIIEIKKERKKIENKAKQIDRKIEILKVRIIERLK